MEVGTHALRDINLESFLGHMAFQEGFEGSTVAGDGFGGGQEFILRERSYGGVMVAAWALGG